jgi:hypothetical protein
VRVYRAEVLEIDRDLSGWSVETSLGHEWVDDTGEGSQVIPIDDQLSVDLDRKGNGFLVRSSHRDRRAPEPHSRLGGTWGSAPTRARAQRRRVGAVSRHRRQDYDDENDEIDTEVLLRKPLWSLDDLAAFLQLPRQTLYKQRCEISVRAFESASTSGSSATRRWRGWRPSATPCDTPRHRLFVMAMASPKTRTEPDYASMTTLEVLDQFEAELERHPGLPQGLVWEIVRRLAATESPAAS